MALLNSAGGVAARNGTNSHTVSFGFTSTSGSFLVFVAAVSDTNAASGWTSRATIAQFATLTVFSKTSAGDSSITVTHSTNDYPMNWWVEEWPTGTTWVNGVTASATNVTMPDLTGLPGTAVRVNSALCRNCSGTSGTCDATAWTGTTVEDRDNLVLRIGSGTEGIYLTVAHEDGVTATNLLPTVTVTPSGGSVFSGSAQYQKIVWAVAEPGGSAATVTPAAVAVVATLPAVTVTAASVVAPAEVTVTAASPQASVLAAATVEPVTVTVTAALPTATVDVTAAATVTPDPVTVSVTVDTPVVSIPVTVTPATVATTVALPTPTTDVSGAAVVTPATVDLSVAFPGPTVAAGWVVTPDPVAVVIDLPAATVTLAMVVTPDVIPVTATVPGPSYTAGATVEVATITVVTVIPTPSLDAVLSAFLYYEAESSLTGAIESVGGWG